MRHNSASRKSREPNPQKTKLRTQIRKATRQFPAPARIEDAFSEAPPATDRPSKKQEWTESRTNLNK